MGRRLTGLALIATAVCLADAASASAAVGCIYHDEATPKYMAVTLTAPGQAAVLRPGPSGLLLVNDAACGSAFGYHADTTNVDKIVVTDYSTGGNAIWIKNPAAFAPGETPDDPLEVAQIEIELDLRTGYDQLVVEGTADADTFTIGADGINASAYLLDDDADIVATGLERTTVYGHYGEDVIDARGGRGTGSAATMPLQLDGGALDDRLTGGAGGDVLDGMGGVDVLEGGLGTDQLDGSAGYDTVSYAHAPGAVTVALDAGEQFSRRAAPEPTS